MRDGRTSPTIAEWAIVVGDELQGKGLGTHPHPALVDEAQQVGIHRFSALIAGENRAVGRLLPTSPTTSSATSTTTASARSSSSLAA